MGKRGPKPVHIGTLNVWEFEFYKAFHMLREGTQLPLRNPPLAVSLSPLELRGYIQKLTQMSPKEYWLTNRRLFAKLGQKIYLNRPPTQSDLEMSEWQRAGEIRDMQRRLNPPKIDAQVNRRKIWNGLVKADTYSSLRKACGRWAQLHDIRRAGLTPFPGHVIANAAQFLSMKRNKRFPRSNYGDNARMDYLARGMAGVIVGVSAMTGIERLRNMKHDSSSPTWNVRDNHCSCWRCSMKRSADYETVLRGIQKGYDDGLSLFMELAATTRIPEQWK